MVKTSLELFTLVTNYFWTAYTYITGNYLALATVIIVVLLSYLIPDITCKIHAKNELMSMKKVMDVMTSEVARAEVACLAVADEVNKLQNVMQDDTTETTREMRTLSVCTSHNVPGIKSDPVPLKQTKIGFFRRFFFSNQSISNKEIAIMSFVYTNSFDAQKKNSPTK